MNTLHLHTYHFWKRIGELSDNNDQQLDLDETNSGSDVDDSDPNDAPTPLNHQLQSKHYHRTLFLVPIRFEVNKRLPYSFMKPYNLESCT